VLYVIKKWNRIISAARTRYIPRDQKFGIEIPHSVKRALEIDRETGTTFWRDAIKKEMLNIASAISILDEGAKPPPGFQWIPCHIIFDVKMDFTRKARFVAGGHTTAPPNSITYASMVSRESVHIAFLLAALNGLDMLAACMNADCLEKVYMTCGPEFGHLNGWIGVIIKALYGLHSSGYAWRTHLAATLHSLDFTMCYADNDVWMSRAKCPDD
jgi:Reverse transcriptase (RNA-dependent DNA polymerase)